MFLHILKTVSLSIKKSLNFQIVLHLMKYQRFLTTINYKTCEYKRASLHLSVFDETISLTDMCTLIYHKYMTTGGLKIHYRL